MYVLLAYYLVYLAHLVDDGVIECNFGKIFVEDEVFKFPNLRK